MKNLKVLVAFVLLMAVFVGNSQAGGEKLIEKFHDLITVNQANQEPTVAIDIPSGVNVDGLLGAWFGVDTTFGKPRAFFIKKVQLGSETKLWILHGWDVSPYPMGKGIREVSGVIAPEGVRVDFSLAADRSNYLVYKGGELTYTSEHGMRSGKAWLKRVPIQLETANATAPAK